MTLKKYLTPCVAAYAAFLFCFSPASAEQAPLPLTPLRELHTATPVLPGGPRYLSAASGLVVQGQDFYVVADDHQILGSFRGDQPLRQLTILDRPALPTDSSLRARLKPDFEALTALEIGGRPYLLALCSGSGELRNSGVLIPLLGQGRLGKPLEFDISPVYRALHDRFVDLNIEGVTVVGERLRLLQRGNSSRSANAVIDLRLSTFLLAASRGKSVSEKAIFNIQEVDLGTTPGSDGPVRWTFTDLCPLDNGRCLFTAAAEDTDNPYQDGDVLGSAVGVLEVDGSVSRFHQVEGLIKLEGISVVGDTVYLVTDSDDPEHPATLFSTPLSGVLR
jgi:hypothetical protein